MPASSVPTEHTTFRSDSFSSTSRSEVEWSIRISSSTSPAFRKAAAVSALSTQKRRMPSSRRSFASCTAPAPYPSPERLA